jgi:hypothetical protein
MIRPAWLLFCLLPLLMGPSCGAEDEVECKQPADVDTSLPPNERDPVQIVDPWLVYTCEDFPENHMNLGQACASNAECTEEGTFCVQGLLPCGGGVCTRSCRMDTECHGGPIDFDTKPPLVCAIPQDGLSVCLPSACLPRVPGWDTTCGPLNGVAVNDLGVGHGCSSDLDCAQFPGTICPGGGPEAHCTLRCQTDYECGPGAACVCVDDADCEEENFVCAPSVDCADAVRHHHCRGWHVPPRDHEFACGGEHH